MESIAYGERLSFEGVELLRYRIEFPVWGENEASSLYTSVADRARAYCREVLLEQLKDEYRASEAPKKRFRFPTLSYLLSGRLTLAEQGLWSVYTELTLTRRGTGKAEVVYRDGQVWQSDESGRCWMLPPSQVAAAFGERTLTRGERRRATGARLEERRVVILERRGDYEMARKGKNG